jgi:DNA-binding transcriptional LysR family regulator
VSQSALSEQIANLERELGCRLFVRGRQGAKLTPNGARLLEDAQGLLRRAADLERSAQLLDAAESLTLRIGATMGPHFEWLPEAIQTMQSEEPGLRIILRDTPTADAVLDVGLGQLDLGIVSRSDRALRGALGSDIETVVLSEEDFVVLVPSGHVLASSPTVTLNRLRDEPLILFSETFSLRQVTNEFFERAGITVTPTIETGWLEMAIQCVRLGLGVTIVPRGVARMSMTNIAILEIDEQHVPRRILTAFYRNDGLHIPVIKRLLQISDSYFHWSEEK